MRAVLALLCAFPVVASASGPSESMEEGGATFGVDLEGPQGIINGEPATRDDFPMAGGMLLGGTIDLGGLQIEGKLVMCSSTLIAPDVVLLAAHCVDLEAMLEASGMQGIEILHQQFAWSRKPDLSALQLTQEALLNPPDWPEDVVLASKVVSHPGFDINALEIGLSENDDIALMFLEEPVFDTPYAFLPTPDEDAQLVEGSEVDVVGWGQQHQDPLPGTVGVKMMGRSYVASAAPYEFHVGPEATDVRKCHGDSGGPSFMYVETDSTEDMRVVGVTSHAYDFTDCRVTGGVDTRVGHYLDWIDAEMRKGCEDGSRSWCEWPGIIEPPDTDGLLAWEHDDVAGDEDTKKACGCSASPVSGVAFWPLLGLVMLARRRR